MKIHGGRIAIAVTGGLLLATIGSTATGATPAPPPPITDAGLAGAVHGMDGSVGVAIARDRLGDDAPLFAGNWPTGTGWSTTKVPVAIAALTLHPTSTTIFHEAWLAITRSDNTAAHELWTSLGTSTEAVQRVDALLRTFGDKSTDFRSEYFGLSTWSLAQQVTFATRLACSTMPAARTVRNLMGEITPTQRWGLGTWSGARFKDGWGPDYAGRYTVRQFGLLPHNGRWIAVAIGAIAYDGAFSTASTELDHITRWLWLHVNQLPSFSCTAAAEPES